MRKVIHTWLVFGAVAASAVGCDLGSDPKKSSPKDIGDGRELPAPANGYLADSGFRPKKDGYSFQNKGGRFPQTPPLVTTNVMTKLFGSEACVGGNLRSCKLTPPANDWANMINRAMNNGQCEGMAVSSLTFFKKIDNPATFAPKALSAHTLTHDQVAPLLGYYWAYQAVNPVMQEAIQGRRKETPNDVEDTLVDMMRHGQLATIGFWGPPGEGGHAVTPYAVEDRGNGVHWIRIYDNNYPDKERYIIMDRNENSWKYDLASINPAVPKMPWSGGPESHNIVVIPLAARLKKAQCPFCRGNDTKTIFPRGNTISISDQDGHTIGRDGDKVVNDIPDAHIIDLSTFIEGVPAGDPMYVVPAEADYDVAISGKRPSPAPNAGTTTAAADDDDEEEHGVTIFGQGSSISVHNLKLAPAEKDTLSLGREGSSVKYRTGTGKMPALKMAVDDQKSGYSFSIANMKADKDDQIEVKVDPKVGHITVQGGGKKTDGYDLKFTRMHPEGEDEHVEQKAIKFHLGESHVIDTTALTKPKTGSAPATFAIHRGVFKFPPPKKESLDKDKAEKDKADKDKTDKDKADKDKAETDKSPTKGMLHFNLKPGAGASAAAAPKPPPASPGPPAPKLPPPPKKP